MDISKLSVKEIAEKVSRQELSAREVVSFFAKRCAEKCKFNAIIEVFDDIFEKADEIDARIKSGKPVGKLAGVPVAIKDNILYAGKKMTCASAFMKDFISPYSATLVKKLISEDAIIFARTNMDEFAMGGSTENSVYGVTKNALDPSRVAGGSSGGSAAAVALGLCPVAIGTDTGGSIRQPSSFNGVVGIKPTFGTVSRYGIVAFASSTDQAAPITKTIEDNEYVLSIIAGKDPCDMTSIDNPLSGKTKSKYAVGIIKELKEKIASLPCAKQFEEQIEKIKSQGHTIKEVSVPHILNSLACYYILTPAEASSNLARFDGVKYTTCSKSALVLDDVYVKSRSEGFGREVKRRIMLGNFVLSSGYFDAYYKKGMAVKSLLEREFARAFEDCDVIITPTTPSVAFKIGERSDPISMYAEDLFTTPASLTGLPALSIPYAEINGLPLGLQIMGAKKSEGVIFDFAKKIGGQTYGI